MKYVHKSTFLTKAFNYQFAFMYIGKIWYKSTSNSFRKRQLVKQFFVCLQTLFSLWQWKLGIFTGNILFFFFLLGRIREVKRLSSLLKAFRKFKMDVFKHIDTKYVKVKKGMFHLSRLCGAFNSSYNLLISQVWCPISFKDLGQNYSFENSVPYCSFIGGEMESRENWCDWNRGWR